ncbi:hypothetical protein SJAV_15380 [Sulfurisphaera javensis]|uniref:Uncharacterized protein n=1 Tax=Sulfurisphaera javensis TaxID=2049879 RepID=A0AAT9GRU7_9CREN
MDKELLNFLLSGEQQKNFKEKDDRMFEILNKLNEIDSKLQLLLKSKPNKTLCEQILEKTYIIVSHKDVDPKLNPSLFILDLDGDKALVTFKDTIELLQIYFKTYKEEVEMKLPRRLMPLFSFLKKNGLIYLDHEDKTYKFI